MTQKIGFIFPGQGSQNVSMGLDLYNNFDIAKDIFNRADEILGKKISRICFEGPEDELKKTINTQSAIVTNSIAAMEVFKSLYPDIKPSVCLGHSLGEYCAMYAAGVMDFDTTLRAIQKRSELMNMAAESTKGSMAAILGLGADEIKKAIENINSVQVANYNEPNQTVITGSVEGIQAACEKLTPSAKRVIPLAVSGGFHSDLMNSASEGFVDFVKELSLNDTNIPVITNVDAQLTKNAKDFREKMPRQINSSVMWYQSVNCALEEGVKTFIEFGSGRVLAGLNRKISAEIKTYNISDKESLDKISQELMIGV